MRRALFAVALCVVIPAGDSSAQTTVYDPAITARNTATAVVKEFLLNTEQQQHRLLRRMTRRLGF